MNKYAFVRSEFREEMDVPGDLVVYVASPMSGSELEAWLTQEGLYPHPYVKRYDLPGDFPLDLDEGADFALPAEAARFRARTAEILEPENHGPITPRAQVHWVEADAQCLQSGRVIKIEPAKAPGMPAMCLVRLSLGGEKHVPENELRLAVAVSPSSAPRAAAEARLRTGTEYALSM